MTYVRVKQAGTGHELTLPQSHVDHAPADAYDVIDKTATDSSGSPLPAKYKTTVTKAASSKTNTPSGHQADTEKEKS